MIDVLARDRLLIDLRSAIYVPRVSTVSICPRCKRRPARSGAQCVECIVWHGITTMRLDEKNLRRYVDLHRKVNKRQELAREIEARIIAAPLAPIGAVFAELDPAAPLQVRTIDQENFDGT